MLPTREDFLSRALDRLVGGAKIPAISGHSPDMPQIRRQPSASSIPQETPMDKPCAHARVQIVAREEDSEFVECLECREIFEASEFKDMAIEEKDRKSTRLNSSHIPLA